MIIIRANKAIDARRRRPKKDQNLTNWRVRVSRLATPSPIPLWRYLSSRDDARPHHARLPSVQNA